MCISWIVITSIWIRLVDLVQNKVEVSGYQSIVLRLWAGLSEASILEGARVFPMSKMFLLGPVPMQPCVQWILRALFLGAKVAGACG